MSMTCRHVMAAVEPISNMSITASRVAASASVSAAAAAMGTAATTV